MWNRQISIDETCSAVIDVQRANHCDRARKNWDWLQDHWPDLLPQAHGKFVAVANQEAFVADTLGAALEWVRSTHPEDSGHIVEFVLPTTGPRIYSGKPC